MLNPTVLCSEDMLCQPDANGEKKSEMNKIGIRSAEPDFWLLDEAPAGAGSSSRFFPYVGYSTLLITSQLVRKPVSGLWFEASSLLGTTYVRLGQFKEAIPYLERAAQSDRYGNVHCQLYVAYRKRGQTKLAQNALAESKSLRRSSLAHVTRLPGHVVFVQNILNRARFRHHLRCGQP